MIPSWPPRSGVLCLVTDRLALARATGASDPISALLRQVAAAVDAGVDLIQVRERDLEAGQLRDLVGACAARAAGSATRVLVNDRLDVALASGAHGVHLRGDSYTVAAARSLAPPPFLVGRSARSAAIGSSDPDYLVLGTVFATPSKPGLQDVLGIAGLARGVSATPVPVLAIGGIAEANLADVAGTGASGIAAIRLFFGLAAGGDAPWRARLDAWREVFDRSKPIS